MSRDEPTSLTEAVCLSAIAGIEKLEEKLEKPPQALINFKAKLKNGLKGRGRPVGTSPYNENDVRWVNEAEQLIATGDARDFRDAVKTIADREGIFDGLEAFERRLRGKRDPSRGK